MSDEVGTRAHQTGWRAVRGRLRLGEAIFPLVVLAATGLYLWDVRDIGQPDLNLLLVRPLAAAVIVIAGYIIVSSVWPRRHGAADKPDQAKGEWKPVGWTVAFLLYLLGLELAGFAIATPPFLVVTMLMLGVRRLLTLVLVSAGLTALFVLAFDVLLGVRLP